MDYSGSYFDHYRELDATPMGKALTRVRAEFVRKHHWGHLIDIGIGGGLFVLEASANGYDVNPEAVTWLKARDRFQNPFEGPISAITCWDSLEHMVDPEVLIAQVTEWVFVSMPIYAGQAHCLTSKHFKPGEHIWYFTHDGLIEWFRKQGFFCMEYTDIESQLGREGIRSYAFRRSNP